MKYYFYIKCTIDFLMALILIMLTLPLCLLIGIGIWATMGRPIIFIQERGGFKNTVFKIYKFRTMTLPSQMDKDLTDCERLTTFGSFIRKSSLDELPQLFNIVKGDMSFIGPRALISDYLSLYNDTQKQRHLVKPGITGLAQVNGRNSLTWEERFDHDLQYVQHYNLFLDIFIAVKTLVIVLKRRDINSKKTETMSRFKGSS